MSRRVTYVTVMGNLNGRVVPQFDRQKAELCQGGRGAGLQFHGRPENIDAHIDQDIGKDRSTAALSLIHI